MSFLKKMKSIPSHLPTGTAKSGLVGFAIDKGERYGAAFAYGAAKGYYGPSFLWRGHGLDLWTGAALTIGSAALNAFTSGRSNLADHMERIGDAGMMSALGSLGAAWGMEKAGRSVAVVSPGKGKTVSHGDVLGAIPAAMGGAFLSADDIAQFANRK